MLRRAHSRRLAVVVATLALSVAACFPDPVVPKAASKNDGTPTPLKTHLRGTVTDFATGALIAGATVTGAGETTTSIADGSYNLQNLRVGATDLVTYRAGYDTARTILPLNGGDQVFNVRMKATVPAATIR